MAARPANDVGQVVVMDRRTRSAHDHAMIEQALDIFLNALPRRLRFAEAAAALGVRPAELLKAYERSGIKPRDQVRAARLDRLHRDLGNGSHATLSDALIHWGFPPSGLDPISDYRKAFGGHPQETLEAGQRRGA